MNKAASLCVVKQARLGDDTCAFTLIYFGSHYVSLHAYAISGLVTKSYNISLKASNDSNVYELCHANNT